MSATLPPRPNLVQLRRQAKDLLRRLQAGDSEAIARCAVHPRLSHFSAANARDARLSLSDAQLVVAREYGFASWPKLKSHVEGLERAEKRVAWLRAAFAAADRDTREWLLSCVHTKERFQHYDPDANTLSEEDARLVVANEQGYAFWRKYESYLYLDPGVQKAIAAVRSGDLNSLRALLRIDPAAANPRWVHADVTPTTIPNDSIPLHCLAEAVFNGTNPHRNDYELARALIQAGADVDLDNGTPLKSAVSYNAVGAARALLEGGAAVDGPDGSGMPMAYALGFGFTDLAELLARFGATLDMRFAAGLGRLEEVKRFVHPDGSLSSDAGRLADPYENRFRCERTRANILSQALYFACLHSRLETVEFLLELGAAVNQEVPGVNRPGGAVLHFLAAGVPLGAGGDPHRYDERRLPVIELLLKRGARVALRDSRFQATPLGWAYHHNAKRVVEVLRPRAGVHDAVRFGLLDRLRRLLDGDPSLVNVRDELGETPLHCLKPETPEAGEVIDLLISRGADIEARNAGGQTPWERMIAAGRSDLAARLRSPRGSVET